MRTPFLRNFLALALLAGAVSPVCAGDLKVPLDNDVTVMFTEGPEYPGATGSANIEQKALVIAFDFTGGGAYVSAGVSTGAAEEYATLEYKLKAKERCASSIRIIDANGECFQQPTTFEGSGSNEDVVIDLAAPITEHWGGDENGILEQPIKELHFVVGNRGEDNAKSGQLEVSDITLKN